MTGNVNEGYLIEDEFNDIAKQKSKECSVNANYDHKIHGWLPLDSRIQESYEKIKLFLCKLFISILRNFFFLFADDK